MQLLNVPLLPFCEVGAAAGGKGRGGWVRQWRERLRAGAIRAAFHGWEWDLDRTAARTSAGIGTTVLRKAS